MFSIEEIELVHASLGTAETLAEYVRALAALGVEQYDSFVFDGHSEYVGNGGDRVISSPVHEALTVAGTSDREAFLGHLQRHERGETSYVEMSQGLAASGIERWTVDTRAMTMTFYDRSAKAMLAQEIA